MTQDGRLDGLRCECILHHSEKTEFTLVRVLVRLGAANRWVEQAWCQRCLEEERVRRA